MFAAVVRSGCRRQAPLPAGQIAPGRVGGSRHALGAGQDGPGLVQAFGLRPAFRQHARMHAHLAVLAPLAQAAGQTNPAELAALLEEALAQHIFQTPPVL